MTKNAADNKDGEMLTKEIIVEMVRIEWTIIKRYKKSYKYCLVTHEKVIRATKVSRRLF